MLINGPSGPKAGHKFYLPSIYVSVIGIDDLKSWKPDAAVETA